MQRLGSRQPRRWPGNRQARTLKMRNEVPERYGKSGKVAWPGEFIATPLLGSLFARTMASQHLASFCPRTPAGRTGYRPTSTKAFTTPSA